MTHPELAPAAPGPPTPGTLPRRLALTLACAVAVPLLQRLPFPGSVSIDALVGPLPRSLPPLTLLALGLTPWIAASLIVELLALLIPDWRQRRLAGAQARRPLVAATLGLGVVFALTQAQVLASWSQAAGVVPAGSPWLMGAVTGLTAGSLGLLGLTELIRRQGLGNGFSLLIAAGALPGLVSSFVGTLRAGLAGPGRDLLPLVFFVALVLALWRLFESPATWTAAKAPARPLLRPPVTGLVPLTLAGVLLGGSGLLDRLGRSAPPLAGLAEALVPGSLTRLAVEAVVLSGLGLACAALFQPRSALVEGWRRVEGAVQLGEGDAPPDPLETRVREALHRLLLPSLALLLLLAAVEDFFAGRHVALDLIGLVTGMAVLRDLLAELQARRRHGELLVAVSLQRSWAVDAALTTLDRAGIPALARAARHRQLWHFFAPYLPVELLVPAPQAAAARQALQQVGLEG